MKRIVFGTLGILLALYATTWILERDSLFLVDPHSNGYYLSNCTWYSWPDGRLNLSSFSGENITGIVYNKAVWNEYFYFTYTPCSNAISCSDYSNNSMISIYNGTSSNNSACLPLTYWQNGSRDPIHYIYGNTYYWEFTYLPELFYNSTVYIDWICDPWTNGDYWTNSSYVAVNNDSRYIFDFKIYSSAACNSSNITNITTTTTTQIPGGDCLWNIGNNVLNLTSFKNQTLVAIDSKNSSLVVAFSPCANLLECNGNEVSSFRKDFINNECVDYLSIWEEGINEPDYSINTKTWQFIYENGEKCNGFENIFEVYWKCDYKTQNKADIVSFQKTGTCTFEMHINSSYACT